MPDSSPSATLTTSVPLSDAQCAERWYQEAFEVAAEVGARISQRRAATKLARLSGKARERSDVAEIVRTAYELFTEGFGTPALVEGPVVPNGLEA
jgi:predicted ATPase